VSRGCVLPRATAAAAALLLAGCGISDPYATTSSSSTRTPSSTSSTTSTSAATTATTTATTTGPTGPTSTPGLSPAQAAETRRASRAVRCFLRGYLPYSYGVGKAGRIRCVTPRLRHELAANPPHTAPDRRARPRVRTVRLVDRLVTRMYFAAQVDDGRRIYAVSATVALRRGSWQVSELS
jgi:hypothetical protein